MGSGDGVKICKFKSGKNLLGKVLYVYIYIYMVIYVWEYFLKYIILVEIKCLYLVI